MTQTQPKTRAVQAQQSASHKFFLLFIFLLAYLILYPYMQHNGAGYYMFRLFASVITALCVYAVSFRRSVAIFALALAIPVLLDHLHIRQADASALSIFYKSLSLAFDSFIIVVIFRRVFFRGNPTAETVFGALCIYLLIGFSFSNVYWLMVTLQSHAFYLDPLTNSHSVPNRFDLIYYSFGTMTSLGAAGITAVSDQARSLSVIEAVLGILYLAVLISRLMGAYRPNIRREDEETASH